MTPSLVVGGPFRVVGDVFDAFLALADVFSSLADVFSSLADIFSSLADVFSTVADVFRVADNPRPPRRRRLMPLPGRCHHDPPSLVVADASPPSSSPTPPPPPTSTTPPLARRRRCTLPSRPPSLGDVKDTFLRSVSWASSVSWTNPFHALENPSPDADDPSHTLMDPSPSPSSSANALARSRFVVGVDGLVMHIAGDLGRDRGAVAVGVIRWAGDRNQDGRRSRKDGCRHPHGRMLVVVSR
ncbi:hypothetical protein EV122DRAFT_285450 [Schizophyllum commune]